jgi:hypothetical protein
MAGVPTIFEAMLASVLPTLTGGPPMLSQSLRVERGEGDIAVRWAIWRRRIRRSPSAPTRSSATGCMAPTSWCEARTARPSTPSWPSLRACSRRPDDRPRRHRGDDPRHMAAGIDATVGPFDLNDGAGGGNRVSAARLSDPLSDGGAVSPGEVSDVATAQTARGTEALFMVFGWQDPLDRLLAAEGYATRDETLILAAPAADIAEAPPPVSCFEIWPPLAVQEEIWDAGGIGPARLRCHAPGRRSQDRPIRTDQRPSRRAAFIAVHGKVAMLHALEVTHRAHGATASPGS